MQAVIFTPCSPTDAARVCSAMRSSGFQHFELNTSKSIYIHVKKSHFNFILVGKRISFCKCGLFIKLIVHEACMIISNYDGKTKLSTNVKIKNVKINKTNPK